MSNTETCPVCGMQRPKGTVHRMGMHVAEYEERRTKNKSRGWFGF